MIHEYTPIHEYEPEPLPDVDAASSLIVGWRQPIAAVMYRGQPIAIVPEAVAGPLAEMLNAAKILRDSP